MRRPLWVEDGSAWINAGAMNWREVGRFGSYLWSRYTRHCWTPTEGKKEGYWYGQLLAFDPSHVTSFFIFAMIPRHGDTILCPLSRLGEAK